MCGKGTARCSRIRSDSGEGETWIMVISMSMNGGGIFFLKECTRKLAKWGDGAKRLFLASHRFVLASH